MKNREAADPGAWVSCGAPPALAVGLALALDDAAHSLRRHHGGFVATTRGSVP
jgi:hypothetical protein